MASSTSRWAQARGFAPGGRQAFFRLQSLASPWFLRHVSAICADRDSRGNRRLRPAYRLERRKTACKENGAEERGARSRVRPVRTHALDHSVDLCAKATAESGRFRLVPVLRVYQFRAGSQGENNVEHYGQRCSSSAFNAAQVTHWRRSGPSDARRRSSSACCAGLSVTCWSSRLFHSCAISARRSAGDRRTISSRVSNSMSSGYATKPLSATHVA